ncbi:MAG: MarR family winged helix-turn-helix transcriptional regulator [Candidatus Acidiferrales bacterium]
MSRPSRERFNFEALADFRYAIRRYLNFSERNARAAGLEPQQYQALLAIKGVPVSQTATVGVLAERLQIQHHSAVELMDRLEKRGLVRRTRSRVDRRQVLVQLTPTGERKLKRVSLPHRDELRTAGRRLLRALEDFIPQNGARTSTQRQPRKSGRRRAR